MRFIGSKARLLQDIEKVIDENTGGQEQVFCDIFSGTGVVARHFKSRYQIISNDILHFSYILQKATIENNRLPDFEKLKKIGILDPFAFLEETRITDEDLEKGRYFIACQLLAHGGKPEDVSFSGQRHAHRFHPGDHRFVAGKET